MGASGSSSLVLWIAGIVVAGALVTGGAWYVSRSAPIQEIAAVPDDPDRGVPGPDSPDTAGSGDAAETSDEPAPTASDTAQKDAADAGPKPATDPEADTSDTETAESDITSDAKTPFPRLHEVRLESDGLAVIAGQVSPFAEVILRLDGEEFARASADGSGAFATVVTLARGDGPRVLTLAQLDNAGGETLSPDELILAPVRVPAPDDRIMVEAAASDETPASQNRDDPAEKRASSEIPDDTPDDTPADTTETAQPVTTNIMEAAEESGGEQVAVLTTAPEHPETSPEPAIQPVEQGAVPEPIDGSEPTTRPQPAKIGLPDLAVKPEPAVKSTKPDENSEGAENVQVAAVRESAEDPEDVAADATETASASKAAEASGDAVATAEEADTEEVAVLAAPEADANPPEQPQATPGGDDASAVQPPRSGPATPRPVPARPGAPEPEDAQQVAILRSNEQGVTILHPADPKPQVMSQVALDSISYSDAGAVQLQGRAQERAEQVRVYLDNRAIAALDVDASGSWRGSLPQVDTGVYTLRIDEIDAEGRVTSRVETPFKREAPEVLAAATANATARISAVTVQRGDTLWAISRDRYGEGILYVRVFEANRDSIRDPDLIYPGQIFSLPAE